jgi:co-chaperonin GroES (HSP10)
MPYMIMVHDVDPKQHILDEIGDISGLVLFNNQVLVGTYVRPEKTVKGLYIPETNRENDKYQSKVGLILKTGPSAFVDDSGQWFDGVEINVGDWVVHRPSDGWQITINGMSCRILDDTSVRGTIQHPDMVW